MTKIINEWTTRAEHDWDTVNLLIKENSKGYEIITFHAQQCIEKYLKAILIKNEKDYPRTHDLIRLINLCEEIYPELNQFKEKIIELNEYAISGRYPGEIIDQEDAMEAYKICKSFREELRKLI